MELQNIFYDILTLLAKEDLDSHFRLLKEFLEDAKYQIRKVAFRLFLKSINKLSDNIIIQ